MSELINVYCTSVGVKSWANVRSLKKVLILFEAISGLKINFNKSLLVGVNVNDSWFTETIMVLNCKIGNLPFLYLGLAIWEDSRKMSFWYSLLQRINQDCPVAREETNLWIVVWFLKDPIGSNFYIESIFNCFLFPAITSISSI